jgi:N-acyl-D-aspartate/D-glutamate deacylase/CubicO group peptidase (beta-lactamase class C family)
MARLSLVLALAVLAPCAPGRGADVDSAALDKLVAAAVEKFEVPGAAVAVVRDDKVVYLKGVGARKKGEPDPVTPDTVFAIASCSKAFTATGVAVLVADGKMAWDDAVRKHLEWFRLSDPAADREVTIRDLLCHRTGMPRHDMLWAATDLTAEEYARAYGRAKHATSFRSTWEYANVPFTTAGLASAHAAGSDWPALIRTRIFEPLGMKSAYCSAREALADPDHAIPHNRHKDGKIAPVARADVDSVRGAGSINASARAMAQWLRFQLADGTLDGKKLIPSATLTETRTAQMVVRREGRWKIFYPDKATRHLSYGLGWFVHDYRGHFACSHGGTLDGFRAQAMLIPDKKLGVVVFGNLTPSTFPEALSKTLIDTMLGLPSEDWNAYYKAQDSIQELSWFTEAATREAARKKDTKPSRDLPAYSGTYEEAAYGKAEVAAETDGLKVRWGRLTWKLDHYHFDTFTGTVAAPPDEVVRYQRQKFDVQFRLGTNGEVEGVKFLDQEFKKTKSVPQFDVLIRGGMVYDGTGAAPRKADIGIRGDQVTAIGDLSTAAAKTVVDANNLAVAPGFVNMLSWSNESLLADGKSQGEIRQGVTTQVMGESDSMGPWNEAIKKRVKAEQTDIKYEIEWTTLSEYLTFLERKGVSQNVASFIGASTIREYVLGRGNKKPTAEDLDRMRKLVELEMRAGALGIGSALEYAPAYYADTAELIELCKVAAKYQGKYISHMRSEGRRLLEGIDEVIRISREAKVPAEIYHFKAAGRDNWSKMDAAIAKVEAARKEGLAITADMYCYTAGCTGLDACVPPWAQDGGELAMRRRLRDPEARKRIKLDIETKTDWPNFYHTAGGPKNVLLVGFKKDALKPLQGKTLADVAAERKADPVDTLMDLLAEDESRITTVYFMMTEDNVRKLIKLSWTSFGSDEASQAPEGVFLKSMPHPRAYGNFARLLGKYVREEKLISLEEAIRKLTYLPANNLGLDRRGLLKDGYFADVVVFDPTTIADRATYEKPHQHSVGMKHVFVNGTQVLKDGEHTGAKPGRALWGPGKVEK